MPAELVLGLPDQNEERGLIQVQTIADWIRIDAFAAPKNLRG